MAEGTQIGPVTLRGRVYNKSSRPVWVLFDSGGVVQAKVLQPNHKSPKNIDADAVGGYASGETISGWAEWWKLPSAVTAYVRDNKLSDGLWVYGQPPGLMSKTKEADWGTINYDTSGSAWGNKIEWWE